MEKIGLILYELKPALLMILVQVMSTVINIFYKLAAQAGMDLRVMVAYRFLFGAAFLVPFAFFLERNKRPKLTWTVLIQAFFAGLFGGSLGQNLYLESLVLTSVTFAAAMNNLIPAVTFVVAVCLRLENLGWKTKAGQAKILGTILGIGGAMVFTFYKGPEIILWRTNFNLLDLVSHHQASTHKTKMSSKNNLIGAALGLVCCVGYSLWLIIQAKAVVNYPCSQSFTAIMVLMSAIQSIVYGLCRQRDWSRWRLGWDIKLLTVAYTGIVGSGMMFALVAICVRMRGPWFVSVFTPLSLLLVAIAGTLVLDENLHVGGVIGGVLIICGLYVVIWGKAEERKNLNELALEKSDGVENQGQKEQSEITIAPSAENDNSSSSTKEAMEEKK